MTLRLKQTQQPTNAEIERARQVLARVEDEPEQLRSLHWMLEDLTITLGDGIEPATDLRLVDDPRAERLAGLIEEMAPLAATLYEEVGVALEATHNEQDGFPF